MKYTTYLFFRNQLIYLLTARKVMCVDQLEAVKKYVGKNNRFEKQFLHFLQDFTRM